MKHLNRVNTGIAILGLLSISAAALANHQNSRPSPQATEQFSVNAKVIDVEPLVRIVEITTPQEVCWNEQVVHRNAVYKSRTPLLLGGIIGGVVGNQMGGGRGKSIMTVAGAILGASIGRDIAQQKQTGQQEVLAYERVCEIEQVTHEEERTDGYRVTYQYDGREFVTYTQSDPGAYIRVRVRIEPLAYNGYIPPGARMSRARSRRNHLKS